MIHPERFGEQAVMRRDHVVVVVLREMRVETVAGLGRLSVADAVGKNDVVAPSIEKLPRTEQFAGKNGRKELMTRAARAMQDQNCVGDASLCIRRGLAQRGVMKAQFGQGFPGAKLEILHYKITLVRGGGGRLLSTSR